MREILPALGAWYEAGAPFGLATVVAVSRSALRGPGATMAVGPGDEVVGSVSGGCVEGAVFELAQEVVAILAWVPRSDSRRYAGPVR